ncbi:MAG TPA: hypothetical protein VE379_08065 [Vicinamibacterales bacterium]|nr:hypothetical protein [Vicinamibacterales bacterium]
MASADAAAKFTTNGAYVEVWGTDASGCVRLFVHAGRGGRGVAAETTMHYWLYNECTNTYLAYGSGRIANDALHVTNKQATLVFSPSPSATFYAEGATGTIALTIEANGVYSTTSSGHSRVEYAGHVTKSHGTWSYESAVASGSILGFVTGNVFASLGESRNKTIEIERAGK